MGFPVTASSYADLDMAQKEIGAVLRLLFRPALGRLGS